MRGHEGGNCGGKCLWRKAREPWKQGDTAESHVGDLLIFGLAFSHFKSVFTQINSKTLMYFSLSFNIRKISPLMGTDFQN